MYSSLLLAILLWKYIVLTRESIRYLLCVILLEHTTLPGMHPNHLLTLLTTEWPPTPSTPHHHPPQPGVAHQADWPVVVIRTNTCCPITEYHLPCKERSSSHQQSPTPCRILPPVGDIRHCGHQYCNPGSQMSTSAPCLQCSGYN